MSSRPAEARLSREDDTRERNEPSGRYRRGAALFEDRGRRWDENRPRRGPDSSRGDLAWQMEGNTLNFGYDDPKLSSLLHRIRRDENLRKRNSALLEFKKYLSEPVSTRAVIRSADAILSTLESLFHAGGNRDNVIHCMGTIGYMMGHEGRKFVQWTLNKVNTGNVEDVKILFMSALSKALDLDSQRLYFTEFIPFLMSNVHMLVENAEAAEFLEPLVEILCHVAKNYPHHFAPHFKDMVDILVGWHVDTSQPGHLIDYIADGLVGMHPFWEADMQFSTNLIGQFLEDMRAYVQDMTGNCVSRDQTQEKLTPEECQGKVTSLLGVLSTVVRGLDSALQPFEGSVLTADYFDEIIQQIVENITLSIAYSIDEELIMSGSDCLSAFASSLKEYLPYFCCHLLPVISALRDAGADALQSASVCMSILDLIHSILTACEENLPCEFAFELTTETSPLMMLRLTKQDEILKSVMEGFHGLIMTENPVIIEDVCRAVAEDIQKLLGHLEADGEHCPEICDEEALLLIDLHIVRKILTSENAVKSAIDSFVEILTQSLTSTSRLALHCPAAHYALVATLGAAWHQSEDLTEPCLKVISDLLWMKKLGLDAKIFSLQWLSQMLDNEHFQRSFNDGECLQELANAILLKAFDRERDVRLKAAHCLCSLSKSRNLKREVQQKILRQCCLKLTDTDGSVRSAFVEVIESLPTSVIIRETVSSEDTFDAVHESWQTRRCLLSQPSNGTFHGHHFQAVINFILKAVTPSRRVNDDWLERLYHSCVRLGSSSDEVEVDGCDALLWFWCLWESAQYIVLSKIKTPLGGPQDTFLAIGNAVKSYYLEAVEGSEPPLSTTVFSKSTGVGPKFFTRHLRVNLLVAFVDFLEKHIYNAHSGCAVMMQPPPKNIRAFFRANYNTCQDWLRRLRLPLATVTFHAGTPAAAVRHCYEKLSSLNADDPEFNQLLAILASSLCRLKDPEPLVGVSAWARKRLGRSVGWLEAASLFAKGCFEQSAKGHRKFIEKLLGIDQTHEEIDLRKETKASSAVMEFCLNQILDCYVGLSDWEEVQTWIDRIERTKFKTSHNFSYIKSLCKFDLGDMTGCREILESSSNSLGNPPGSGQCSNWEQMDLEHLCKPSWDPWQMLQASQTQLLFAVSSSGKSKTVSVTEEDDEDPIPSDDEDQDEQDGPTSKPSHMNRVLNHAAGYSEVYLRVSALQWPIIAFPHHTAQMHCLRSIRSDFNEDSICLNFSDSKCLNPTIHDVALSSHLLRHARRRHSATDSLFNLTVSSLKLARKQGNYEMAKRLLSEAASQLLGSKADHLTPEIVLETLATSGNKKQESGLQIAYEGARLMEAIGKQREAVFLLTQTLANHHDNPTDLFSRSLVRLSKWIQSDHLAALLIGPDSPISDSVSTLMPPNPFQVYPTSGLSEADGLPGVLLKMATESAPRLAKAWVGYAGWCYRWGRKTIEQTSLMGNVGLLHEERSSALAFLPNEATEKEIIDVLCVLGQAHFSTDTAGLQVELVENEKSGSSQGTADVIRQRLIQSCPSLANSPAACRDQLMSVWHDVSSRLFTHYRLAARAYFTYLNLSGGGGNSTTNVAELNVVATLRLLRLLAKHAQELRDELEEGLRTTPTEPWKAIIPQLFSRLSHPEASVCQSVSQLLCRIAQDSPHLIVYPAVVGCPLPSANKQTPGGNEKLLRSISRMDSLTSTYNRHGTDSELGQTYVPTEMLDNLPVSKPRGDQSTTADQEEEEEEEEETQLTALQTSHKTILDTLTQHYPSLVADTQAFVEELKRIRLLWDELWMGALSYRQTDVSRRLVQLDREVKRVWENATLSKEEKIHIMGDKHAAVMKPVIVALEKIYEYTAQEPETPHEEWFQKTYGNMLEKARDGLKKPKDLRKPGSCWEGFKQFHQALFQRSQKRAAMALKLSDISPKLANLTGLSISLPGASDEDGTSTGTVISSFLGDVTILPTKTRPKKLSVRGSDGKRHSYLFKGLEDMHLDERVMQFLAIVNTMFAKVSGEEQAHFKARHYAVTPLGSRSGLVKWVDGATPLFALYKRWQQREVIANSQQSKPASVLSPIPPATPQRPSELFYGKLTALLKEKGITDLANRKEWPLDCLLKALEHLVAETPSDLLAKELWCASTGALEWWHMTQTYCHSMAVMSIVGYVIGLGDRHLDNLMIDLATGEIVHIDYNVCFEKGKGLRVPERVPFRLTQNIERALGMTGIEGTFRLSCEHIMKTLRRGRETLLTLLEAFVYDPLVDWTIGNEEVFTAAKTLEKNDGAAHKGQQGDEKKEMERDIMVTMFSSRVAEMRVAWKQNKGELIGEMDGLIDLLDIVMGLVKSRRTGLEKLERLREKGEILQEVLKRGPSHPIFEVKERHKEYQKLQDEYQEVLQSVQEKQQDSEQWQAKHEDVLTRLYAGELRGLRESTLKSVELDLTGSDATAEFLAKTSQSHLVVQCQKAQEELQSLMSSIHSAVHECLGLLATYESVGKYYASTDFISGNRCQEWNVMFGDLLVKPSSGFAADLLKAYVAKHRPEVDIHQPEVVKNKVKGIHREMHASLMEHHARLTKLKQRCPNNANIEVFEKAAVDVSEELKKSISANQQLPSLCTIVISALATLNMRWLVMEKTAAQAGERLQDLRSREGDWFLDELQTISLNACHFAELLKRFGQLSEKDYAAITAIQPVYTSLQDLVHSCVSLLAPDLLRALLSEESGWDEFFQSLEGAHSALNKYLKARNKSKGDSDQASLLDFAKVSYMDLNQPSWGGCYGQIFRKLDQLFDTIEHQLTKLWNAIQKQNPIPPQWLDIDVVKETSSLQAQRTTIGFGPFFTEEPVVVKRLPIVWSFFKRCHQYATCLKTAVNSETPPELVPWLQHVISNFARSSSSPSNSPTYLLPPPANRCLSFESIITPIKQFVSDVILQQVLGVPSEALASVVLHYLPRLGFNVDDAVVQARHSSVPLCLEPMAKRAIEVSLQRGIVTRESLAAISKYVSGLDNAWRRVDLARRLEINLSLSQKTVQEMQLHLIQFQWFFDDFLSANNLAQEIGVVNPSRNSVMMELRKASKNLLQLESTVKSQMEKLKNSQVTIIQRLRWAAGSNPQLKTAIEEMEERQTKLQTIVQTPLKQLNEVSSLAETVLHFEAHRTRTQESNAGDKFVCNILSRFCKSAKAVEENASAIKETEKLYQALRPLNDSSALPQQVTKPSIELLVGVVVKEKRAVRTEMQSFDQEMEKQKQFLANQSVKLEDILKRQSGLLQDVWVKLQALVEYEGGLAGPISTYTKQRKRFSDDVALLIETLKSGWDDQVPVQRLKNVSLSLKSLAIWLYDQLLVLSPDADFVSPPSENTSLAGFAEDVTDYKENGTEDKKDQQNRSSASKQRGARDPKTGKALQERNTFAVNVWRRVKAKLEGRDVDPNKRMSVAEQVEWVIQQATSKENLALMYEGWTSWV
eukprot:m.11633 g.11633  ORF g.11633 m.11633 type:complete len:3440 (+) comp23529_c0_seq1:72-10391(+)